MRSLIYLLFLLLLIPVVNSELCNGNGKCEFNTFILDNGVSYAYTPAGSAQSHAIKATYISQDVINLDFDNGEGGGSYSRGGMGWYSSTGEPFGFYIEDIDDISKKTTILFGENALSCRDLAPDIIINDCHLTHPIKIGQISPQILLPSVSCAANCFMSWKDAPNAGFLHTASFGGGQPETEDTYFSTFLPSDNKFIQLSNVIKSRVTAGYSGYFSLYGIPANNEGLVLFESQNNIFGFVKFEFGGNTQRINITTGSSNKHLGGAAFDPINRRWLVVWAEQVGSTNDYDIQGAFVNFRGQIESSVNVYIDPSRISTYPDVAFDTDRNVYILAWRDLPLSASGGDIVLAAYDKNGIRLSSLIAVQKPGEKIYPSVKAVRDKILVMFGYNGGTQNSWDVFGQFFDLVYQTSSIGGATLTSLQNIVPGQEFAVSASSDYEEISGGNNIVYNTKTNEFVSALTKNSVSGYSVLVKRIDTNGNEVSRRELAGYKNPSIAYLEWANRYVIAAEKVGSPTNPQTPIMVYTIFLDKDLNTPTGPPVLERKYTAPIEPFTRSLDVKDITNNVVRDGDALTANTVLIFSNPSLGPRMKLGIKPTQGNINLSGLAIEASDSATVVRGLSGVANLEQIHSLFLPNNNAGAGIFVCPGALALSEVNESCLNKIELASVPSANRTISVSFTDATNTTYLVDGLQNTGIGLIGGAATVTSLSLSIEGTKAIEEQIVFRANYTKNSLPILNATCTIRVSTPPTNLFNMTFSNNSYVYNRTFSDAATYQTTIECSKANEINKTKTEQFTILVGVAKAPTVLLKYPPNGFASTNNTLTFECLATDTEIIKSIDLFTNTDGTWKFRDTKTGLSSKNESTTFTLTNIPNGQFNWNCRATNDKNALGFSLSNFTFSVNAAAILDCAALDWICNSDWSPTDASCQPGTTQTRTCPRPTNCKNPDAVKPNAFDSKACPNVACISTDYQCSEWSECIDKGEQTRSCGLKAGVTCSGNQIKTETQSCTPPGNPWLLIIIVIVVVLAVVGGLFFYFHKKATTEPEESLWEEGGGEYLPEEEEK